MSHNCLDDIASLVPTSYAEPEPDSNIPPVVSPSDSESEPDSDDMPPLVSPSDSESEPESPAFVRGSALTDEGSAVAPVMRQATRNDLNMLCQAALLIVFHRLLIRADELARIKIIEITDREMVVSIPMQKRNRLEHKHIVFEHHPGPPDDTLARFTQFWKEQEGDPEL